MSDAPDIKIVSYAEIDGQRNFSDTQIKALFQRYCDEGTMEKTFCTGLTKTPDEFVLASKSSTNVLHIVFYNGEPWGTWMMQDFAARRVWLHFAAYKKFFGTFKQVGTEYAKYLFSLRDSDGGPLFNVLLGAIPTTNRLAIKGIKSLGAKESGVIPDYDINYYTGKKFDAQILYMTRKDLC